MFFYAKSNRKTVSIKETHVALQSDDNTHEANNSNVNHDASIATCSISNSMSLSRIWVKLGGNSSYKLPGASCAAQGHQEPEIITNLLFISSTKNTNLEFWT